MPGPRVVGNTFYWADGKRKTVGQITYAKKLSDGTVVAWKVDHVKLRHPSKETFEFRNLGGIKHMSVVPRRSSLMMHPEYWSMSQFFYEPGDRLHVNGGFVEVFGETYKKNLAQIKKDKYKKVTREQLWDMMPTSFSAPFGGGKSRARRNPAPVGRLKMQVLDNRSAPDDNGYRASSGIWHPYGYWARGVPTVKTVEKWRKLKNSSFRASHRGSVVLRFIHAARIVDADGNVVVEVRDPMYAAVMGGKTDHVEHSAQAHRDGATKAWKKADATKSNPAETHGEHAKKAKVSTPCTQWTLTLGGRCLNCGFDPAKKNPEAKHKCERCHRLLRWVAGDTYGGTLVTKTGGEKRCYLPGGRGAYVARHLLARLPSQQNPAEPICLDCGDEIEGTYEDGDYTCSGCGAELRLDM